MKFPIRYDSQSMTLTIQWGKHYKFLQCPFRTWWKARKYFKKPKFKFYFGPMWKYKGRVKTKFGGRISIILHDMSNWAASSFSLAVTITSIGNFL